MPSLFDVRISSPTATFLGILWSIVWCVLLWFIIAQSVKRLHDSDHSGWYLLLIIVPVLGQIFALYLLYLLFMKDGFAYENTYGPDPKGRIV